MGDALQASGFYPMHLATPILNKGLNVGKTISGKLDYRTVSNVLLTTTFFILYKIFNRYKNLKIQGQDILYDVTSSQLKETPEMLVEKHLKKIENHKKKVDAAKNWLKDVEKRINEETKKIEVATRSCPAESTRPVKESSHKTVTQEEEIKLDDGTNEKQIIEKGVDKIQKGLKRIEELMEKYDNGSGKVFKDHLGSYRHVVEIPEDKMKEFDEGLELFQEGINLIKDRVKSYPGGEDVDEIKIEFEEQDKGEKRVSSRSRKCNVVEESLSKEQEGTFYDKKSLVEEWIKQIDKMIKKETDKIKEEVAADIIPQAQYIQREEEGKEYNEENKFYAVVEGKSEEWKNWMNDMEKVEWKRFLDLLENHKKKWLQSKEIEWDNWLTNVHYNWIGFINKLEGEFINDKISIWNNWKEKDWKGYIEMEWKRHMKVKWINLVKENDNFWEIKVFYYWDKWHSKKLKEWKSKHWKCDEYEMWIKSEKNIQNDTKFDEWKKRLQKENNEWEKWISEKKDILMDMKWPQWEKWKEYKWKYLNEWLRRVEQEWLNQKPWETWMKERNSLYESHEKEVSM
ncbi:tryptophan-rich protein [Plasmodium brasilianum]|uniref:Tryptophan-rich protein n=1 Tax=Plasmodium brasilianum TaxID=5824 RepID=A0ACB9Y4A9_PLABR|nr:tryptophan-rich protein [Plasmodium brasilianum]